MLDFATVFSRSGLVLWELRFLKMPRAPPVNALVREVLVEERAATTQPFVVDNFAMRWAMDNALDLVFVVATSEQAVWRFVTSDDALTVGLVCASRAVIHSTHTALLPARLPKDTNTRLRR